jgi:hypothetical protein
VGTPVRLSASLVCLLFVLRVGVGARDASGAIAALVHKHEGALTHEWAVVFALLHRLSVADGTDAHLRATVRDQLAEKEEARPDQERRNHASMNNSLMRVQSDFSKSPAEVAASNAPMRRHERVDIPHAGRLCQGERRRCHARIPLKPHCGRPRLCPTCRKSLFDRLAQREEEARPDQEHAGMYDS